MTDGSPQLLLTFSMIRFLHTDREVQGGRVQDGRAHGGRAHANGRTDGERI